MGNRARTADFPSPSASDAGDVVIVGAGLAGLFTALKLAPMPVTLIAAAPLGERTSSASAQGGIAAAVSEGDRPEDHARDTIAAGAGLVDEGIARLLARDAPERLDDLLGYGVPFDRDLEGKLKLSREAAHGARRIARVKGDMAGKAIMTAITKTALETPSIRVLDGFAAHGLLLDGARVSGIALSTTGSWGTGQPMHLPARAVVLATGGLGQLYSITTNPRGANGDGLAIAARAGAVIADAEFMQFHPTAMDVGRDPAPLATEALRGEGALLINGQGKRFMLGVHPDAELAPRDIVARAVFAEVLSGRGAFLDCREAIGTRVEAEFPALFENAKMAGLNPATDPIPIQPGAHYHMGGVLTDASGRTTVEGLWACGEVASTGVHGANRLASNSLLETVVFGARVAQDIASLTATRTGHAEVAKPPKQRTTSSDAILAARVEELRGLMSAHVGVVRERGGLERAIAALRAIEAEHDTPPALANMALAARFIACAALERKESRGAHFRTDFPDPRADRARRSYLSLTRLERIGARLLERSSPPAHAASAVLSA